jgi:2-polyprenyl-3-methyl-5-hydroxy-6-metoxy-1,4-benzoquinol methylase
MIDHCPICLGHSGVPVLELEKAPLVVALKEGAEIENQDFAPLRIVACDTCGHLYNDKFDSALADRMYGETPLTNVPVNVSMVKPLRDVAEWIGVDRFAAKHVVEVGSGSGHLARIIAERARVVTIFEPCIGLTDDALPEDNIRLITDNFSAALLDEPADLIICRQVIEHVADPARLIGEIAVSTKPGGFVYLEVPRAEYIIEHAAFNGFYLAHVQYFSEAHFTYLAAKAGLRCLATLRLKNGHDFGILLENADAPDNEIPPRPKTQSLLLQNIAGNFETRCRYARDHLSTDCGPLGIYGATSQSQALLAKLGDDIQFAIAFDDNAHLDGLVLHGGGYPIPIHMPSQSTVKKLSVIVIGAYLHDVPITKKLRDWGFEGKIYSARPDFGEAAEFGAKPLFAE